MRILLTGATGYIGKRLLPVLIENGHEVICCVRDKSRFSPKKELIPHIRIIEIDLLKKETVKNIPEEIDVSYYLVHSMSSAKDYGDLEKASAVNFREALEKTNVKQVIYLSGIINDNNLSKHLSSRMNVENELKKGNFHLTTLRAGIIIGSGSASFEIIRDLVEKLPLMITPKWLNTRCQPIAVSDVMKFLTLVLLNDKCLDKSFDIGGKDILTYKEMLLQFAEVRKLKRFIYTVPVMTPRLSSYWLYFVTSTSYKLAVALVDSMKVEVVCQDDRINKLLGVEPITYKEALERSFYRIERDEIVSSWKDSLVSGRLNMKITDFLEVPTFGCFLDKRIQPVSDKAQTINKIWKIGGRTGWYYATWLWRIRGFLDKVFGGVGLRRGRTHEDELLPGDAVDFWRVLYANRTQGRLLLFAEMKLPGDAWLEFKIEENNLIQTATFMPKGLKGRLYWYLVYPFHGLIFNGLIKKLTAKR